MNRIRTIFMAMMILLPAVGVFAVVPGGSIDGVGGLDERTPAVQRGEVTPNAIPATVGEIALDNADVPNQLGEVKNSPKSNTATVTKESTPESSTVAGNQESKKIKLTRQEKKDFRSRVRKNKKSLKDALSRAKRDRKSDEGSSSSDVALLLLVIIAILLPPLAVFLHESSITINFWLCLILTLIFWLPGIIFALVVILSDF